MTQEQTQAGDDAVHTVSEIALPAFRGQQNTTGDKGRESILGERALCGRVSHAPPRSIPLVAAFPQSIPSRGS